ncbi:MAG: hypothetical protein HYZ13_09780 [Acidobacteria bacterium]|nr:hypothetical protein [Acidobacteriota bacterium]
MSRMTALAALLALAGAALLAQDRPPFDNPYLDKNLNRADLARPIPILDRKYLEVGDLQIFRPTPPPLSRFQVFAGLPDKDGSQEGLAFYAPCFYRPVRITAIGRGAFFVGQENGEVRLIDGTNAWHWFVPSGTPEPLAGFPNTDIAQGSGGSIVRSDRFATWVWPSQPSIGNRAKGLALDGHDRLWAVDGEEVEFLDANTGSGLTSVIPKGTPEPFQGGTFKPTLVAADPSLDRVIVASDEAIYEVDPRTKALRHLAGIPGSRGYSLDGPGDQARFIRITGIAVHRSGWILVSEGDGFMRWVKPTGEVETIKLGGPGLYYRMVELGEVAFDGDVALVTDAFHHVVWKVY